MKSPAKSEAFLDSATLHDAFAALRLGEPDLWPAWTRQCLVDTTYLLLFDNAKIVPAPGTTFLAPMPGDEQALVAEIPTLNVSPPEKSAEAKLRRWLAQPNKPLQKAWDETVSNPQMSDWCEIRRELFWLNHVRAHDALFNGHYIPQLAPILNVPESVLREVHTQSTDPKIVKKWAKGKGGADAQLANDAYVLSSLIRGKFHEYMARGANLQLAAHPHRVAISAPIASQIEQPIPNSAAHFVRLLLGSALCERPAIRVATWRRNLVKARSAIREGTVNLDDLPENDFREHAIRAARRIGIDAQPQFRKRLMSLALETGFGVAGSLFLGPWAWVIVAGNRGYKLVRGNSPTDSIASLKFDHDFHCLAESVPGRITRGIIKYDGKE